jgi:hypothetical protein
MDPPRVRAGEKIGGGWSVPVRDAAGMTFAPLGRR